MARSFELALIADPHFHAIRADYGFAGRTFEGQAGAAIRTLADTVASTRVFNESYFALPAALDAVVADGLKHVIIVGDLSDDGQRATMDAAVEILRGYEARHGLRFYLTPGNHDFFAMHGRDHEKRFLDEAGRAVLVGSTPTAEVRSPAMACDGYPEGLAKWQGFGVFPHRDDLHWETPFGTDGALSARRFAMVSPNGCTRHEQVDASYLVEPQDGLWILSVDANVFPPRDGCPDQRDPDAASDSTDAGWNAMLVHKPFILDWMKDVRQRAERLGKTLVSFSHYPMVDPLKDTLEEETTLFGDTHFARRTPRRETALRLAETGIRHHFSGHLHIDDTSFVRAGETELTNHALPSLVAFPPAWKRLTASPAEFDVTTNLLDVPQFGAFFETYRQTAARSPLTETTTYVELLEAHMREMVIFRYFPEEWPPELALALRHSTLEEFLKKFGSLGEEGRASFPLPGFASIGALPTVDLLADFYRLRSGQSVALQRLDAGRCEAYLALAAALRDRHLQIDPRWRDALAAFGSMLAKYVGAGSSSTSCVREDDPLPFGAPFKSG